ncbi:hypothetical protein HNP52_002024 [Sphingomonas kyeonggiensis]|uniref:Uncharacterized protein n=1 Tax=Sphingomonas kyeonggiensis TaxID=1268553 RepID=A0A7W7NR72_9SPHN|nr:hypothetical protein [Sphingomonas kyeonggiensis]MBB4838955.1 hypothetical protein [Sphingomonas kyeonggiensis]
MTTPPFDRSVFVNCPFDEEFAPLLQAIAFCITNLGFFPRLAPENADNAANRLDRIVELIRGSKFGIHDLSRCKSAAADEYARLNMPFELGLDHACARFGGDQMSQKTILILEETRYDYQKSLSDISGWDIQTHEADYVKIVRIISSWLISHAGADPIGPSKIQGDYLTFQEWYWERELDRGASDDDIKAYPTAQFIAAMREWVEAGRPD